MVASFFVTFPLSSPTGELLLVRLFEMIFYCFVFFCFVVYIFCPLSTKVIFYRRGWWSFFFFFVGRDDGLFLFLWTRQTREWNSDLVFFLYVSSCLERRGRRKKKAIERLRLYHNRNTSQDKITANDESTFGKRDCWQDLIILGSPVYVCKQGTYRYLSTGYMIHALIPG